MPNKDDNNYITKGDLESVIQRVRIENDTQEVRIANPDALAKPLIEEEKKKSLKELERSIEQKVLFQDIVDGINGLGDSLLKGFKSLIPKTDGGLSKLLGLGLGLLLAPFVGFIEFVAQLGRELNFFTKGRSGKLFSDIKIGFKNFFTNIFSKLKNNKIFKTITDLVKKVFGGKGGKGFFKGLIKIFKAIAKFATGGPFKMIMSFAKGIGRILGKVFLPITILMAVFDFVKGFMKGYKEGGIIGGITEGIVSVFDGLIGSFLRLLGWIPKKLFELLGLDNLAAAVMPAIDSILDSIKNTFRGLVDVVVGIFTLDGTKIKEGLTKIWNSILNIYMVPFQLLGAFFKDMFGVDPFEGVKETFKQVIDTVTGVFENLKNGIFDVIRNKVYGGAALIDFFSPKKGSKKVTPVPSSGRKVINHRQRQLNMDYSFGRPGGNRGQSSSNSNNQTNNNVSNNVSYNIQGRTDLASTALNFATT
tara:strand:+ start:794 stop:2218 length:1425 start_codon:yes stop_codon:yes gene_type:complete